MSKEIVNAKMKLHLVLENINDLVAILSSSFPYTVEFLNETQWKKVLNYSEDDLIDNSFLDIIDEPFLDQVNNILRSKKEYRELEKDIRLKTKNGLLVWFEIKKSIYMDNIERDKILIILKEISRFKELEEEVRNSEEDLNTITKSIPEIKFWRLFTPKKYEEALNRSYEMLELVINNIPQYIYWKDNDLNYLGCNSNYAKLIGLNSPERLIGKKNSNIFTNIEKIDELNEKEREILKTGQSTYHREEIWDVSNNSPMIIDINRVPLKDLEEKIVGILVSFQDITEKIEKDKKLRESEQKYRNLIETSSVGILELNLIHNEISYINPKLIEILGFDKKEKVTENEIKKYVPIHDLKERVQSNENKKLEFKINDNKGELKWISGKYVNHYNSEGELITLRFWLEDITERKKYEDLITELNMNFLNFSTEIQDNIKTLLKTCKKLLNADSVVYVSEYNKGKQKFFQLLSTENNKFSLSKDEFETGYFLNNFFKKNHDFVQYYNIDIKNIKFSKTDPFIKNHLYSTAFGKKITSDDTSNSIICCFFNEKLEKSAQNQLVLFLIADAIEIEQKRWKATQHLRKQNIRLHEMDKLKAELFSRVAHELKTPLISIKGYAELMKILFSENLTQEMISILKSIEMGCRKLERIVNKLLESSRFEQKKLRIKTRKANLSMLIKKSIEEMQGFAKSRNHTIESNLHKNLILKFDEEQIHKVLTNLISNAIKYTPPGGIIKVKSEKYDSKIIISIEDNGIGFKEEEKKYLFKKFGKIERWGQGWDVDIDGTGLGLYISKKIVDLHKGKIWMKSKGRNEGSTFYFSLPIVN
ncbi:MAG: PAS domain S-box protein [Promethearchaeota archaeon]|nr:MAG: PAS domain S-box protein [Candidatus Lokiarchaeota archaeon]